MLGSGWWTSFLLLQNLSSRTMSEGLIITWSLCVELSFYVLVPLLAWAVRRAGRRFEHPWWHTELTAIGVFGTMSVVSLYLASARDLPLWVANSLLATSLWFAPGMGLAVMSVAAEGGGLRAERIRAWLAGHAGLLWTAGTVAFLASARIDWLYAELGIADVTILVRLSYILMIVLPAVFGGCVLAPIAAGTTGRVHAIAGWRPLMLLGLVSYGVFLWHAVLARRVATGSILLLHHFVSLSIITLVVSILVATVSYHVVELPFLRLKYRDRRAPAGRADDDALRRR